MRRLIVAGKKKQTQNQLTVNSPYDGEVVDRVCVAGDEDVEEALASCDKARKITSMLTRYQRANILGRVSDLIARRRQELEQILVLEVGKTISEARAEVDRAIATFSIASEEAKRIGGEIVPFDSVPQGRDRRGYFFRVPIGTVIAITPFNFPLNLAAHKVGPAMAAANPFILKPASQTPITGLLLGEIILEAGYPEEAISVLPGSGESIGMKLVKDERPRMITFTGSAEVGKRIANEAGFKRLTMELGSNSAVVVSGSADIDYAVERIVYGAFALAGQVCISVQRVLVENRIFSAVVEKMKSATESLKVGNPMEESTQVGPMISIKDAERIQQWIDEAVSKGADLVCGGKRHGSIVTPAIIVNVNRETKLWKDEAFAPVVCVNAYENFDQAIEMVNDSKYGLQTGIFTNQLEEALRAVEFVEAGGIMINDVPTYRVDHMPYGGMKQSGMGREGLRYAIMEMTEEKLVCFNLKR